MANPRHIRAIVVIHGTADDCVTHERAAQYFRSVRQGSQQTGRTLCDTLTA